MRNFTSKLTIDEMYRIVADDPEYMKLLRTIDSKRSELAFCHSVKLSDQQYVSDLVAEIDSLRNAQASMAERIIRRQLAMLDKQQLIDIMLTGEYAIKVPTVTETSMTIDQEYKPSGPEAQKLYGKHVKLYSRSKKLKAQYSTLQEYLASVSEIPYMKNDCPTAHDAGKQAQPKTRKHKQTRKAKT